MTSVEDQLRTARIEHLIATPASHRALSIEPLLGPVKLDPRSLEKIDWVIVGGESGAQCRPMQPKWVLDIRNHCEAAGVKFLFKQWGCWTPDDLEAKKDLSNSAYFADQTVTKPILLSEMDLKERRRFRAETKGGSWMFRTSKKRAGNLLDGERHLAHPFGRRIAKSELVVALSPEERERLRECEEIIRAGLGTFISVGTALMDIRNARLYRQTHSTFEDYVNSVQSLSRTHAYQLIDSAQVVRDLSAIEDIPRLPTNEAQARELTRIKLPEERVTAWRKVLEEVGQAPLTAKRVRDTLFPKPHAARDPKLDRVSKIDALIAKLRAAFAGHPNSTKAESLLERLENLTAG